MMFAITLLAARPTPAEDEAWDHLKTRIELAPQEVATFIERRTGCNHFDGEAGSDYPERENRFRLHAKGFAAMTSRPTRLTSVTDTETIPKF